MHRIPTIFPFSSKHQVLDQEYYQKTTAHLQNRKGQNISMTTNSLSTKKHECHACPWKLTQSALAGVVQIRIEIPCMQARYQQSGDVDNHGWRFGLYHFLLLPTRHCLAYGLDQEQCLVKYTSIHVELPTPFSLSFIRHTQFSCFSNFAFKVRISMFSLTPEL